MDGEYKWWGMVQLNIKSTNIHNKAHTCSRLNEEFLAHVATPRSPRISRKMCESGHRKQKKEWTLWLTLALMVRGNHYHRRITLISNFFALVKKNCCTDYHQTEWNYSENLHSACLCNVQSRYVQTECIYVMFAANVGSIFGLQFMQMEFEIRVTSVALNPHGEGSGKIVLLVKY